jgi:predicted permease
MSSWQSWLTGEWARVRGLAGGRRREARFEDEARFHLDMLTERHLRRGVPGPEARRLALMEFGGVDRFGEAARDEYRSRPLEEFGRDVRMAARNLARMPAFTSAAILTLALGIGATTVVYSVVDHVVLRPLPFRDADRLIVVREVIEEIRHEIPSLGARAAHYLAWRERCDVCDDVAALLPVTSVWRSAGEPVRVRGIRVSANLFPLLGVHAEHGRLFLEEEDTPERSSVVVVSHGFWQRHLGGDPDAVGRSVRLGSQEREVIGVLPARFRLPKGDELGRNVGMHADPDFYIPLALSPAQIAGGGNWDYVAIARLAPGVGLEQAERQLDALQRSLGGALPEPLALSAVVVPMRDLVVGSAGRGLLLLLAAVGSVLLLVCVNLANLLLARNASRSRESAVRAALGARRMRLVREALTETMLLALVAGVLGVVLSWWGLQLLLQIAPPDLPRLHEVRLDARIAGVALLLALGTGVFFGALPALRSAGADPADVLKSGGRARGGGPAARRGRDLLIATQSAMTAMLLIAAGLFLTSFVRVLGIDKGFAPERVLALDVLIPATEYDSPAALQQIYERILHELSTGTEFDAAAATSKLPLEGTTWLDSFAEEGSAGGPTRQPSGNFHSVTPDYFRTLGIPLASGRAFTQAERGADVVVLSQAAAHALWPGEPVSAVLGRRVALGGHLVAEVIGVAADVTATGLEAERAPILYVPPWTAIGFPSAAAIAVRTTSDPVHALGAARAAIRRAAPGAVVSGERTLEQLVSNAAAERRFQMSLLILFAATALTTACVGIYGVVAHSLARRTGEIGVRMALGARRTSIHRLVLAEGIRPTLVGLVVGIAAMGVAGRLLRSLLYEARPVEPGVLVGVVAILLMVATVACYVPARRATAGNPSALLRHE